VCESAIGIERTPLNHKRFGIVDSVCNSVSIYYGRKSGYIFVSGDGLICKQMVDQFSEDFVFYIAEPSYMIDA